MKIPEKIRIGGVDYEVVECEYLENGSKFAYGHINYNDCTIELSQKHCSNHQTKSIVFLHEVLHGIANHLNIQLPEDTEEDIIDTFAKGLYQVLQDNGRKLFDIVAPAPSSEKEQEKQQLDNTKEEDDNKLPLCPNCKHPMSHWHTHQNNYCPHCGVNTSNIIK